MRPMLHSTSGVMMSEVKESSFGPILSLPFGSVSAPFSRGEDVLHDTIEQVIMANKSKLHFLMMIRFRNLAVKLGNNLVRAEAKANNFKYVCVTDHFWSENVPIKQGWKAENFYLKQNFSYISQILPLPQDEKVKFLFGCETDIDEDLNLGIKKDEFDLFDFVIIATTHLHMYPFISVDKTAENLMKRFNALINIDLPSSKIGLAHPTCLLIAPDGQTKDVLNSISNSEFIKIFDEFAKKQIGIELNKVDFDSEKVNLNDIKASLRVLKIARNCGCKFYLASDAHHPKDFINSIEIFNYILKELNLQEENKFIPLTCI